VAPIDAGKEDRAARGLPIVAAFDGYRAFAILGIVFFHLVGLSGLSSGAGDSLWDEVVVGVGGWLVNVLFVVSGFVVFLPTVARGGQLGSVPAYALRRAARLLPAFWVALALLLALMALLNEPGASPRDVALNFSGVHEVAALFIPGFKGGFGINGAIWTLSLEISFYIVLPLIAASYFRRPLLGLALAAAVAIGWRIGFAHIADLGSLVGLEPTPERADSLRASSISQLPSWGFSFAAGMTGAWAYVRASHHPDQSTVQRLARSALAVSVPALIAFAYLAGHKSIGHDPLAAGLLGHRDAFVYLGYTASLAGSMVALTLTAGRQRPFALPISRHLGDISYGVFLMHLVIAWVIFKFFWPYGTVWSLLLWMAMVYPASLAYGYLSARMVELPIRRWAHRFGRRAQVAAPVRPAPAEASSQVH
jgi:peptidoglycan/LPS O-acetylase OafA/YrhL